MRQLGKNTRRKRVACGVRDSAACGKRHSYCLLLLTSEPEDSFASRTRALSSFFCTLLISPGSASAGSSGTRDDASSTCD